MVSLISHYQIMQAHKPQSNVYRAAKRALDAAMATAEPADVLAYFNAAAKDVGHNPLPQHVMRRVINYAKKTYNSEAHQILSPAFKVIADQQLADAQKPSVRHKYFLEQALQLTPDSQDKMVLYQKAAGKYPATIEDKKLALSATTVTRVAASISPEINSYTAPFKYIEDAQKTNTALDVDTKLAANLAIYNPAVIKDKSLSQNLAQQKLNAAERAQNFEKTVQFLDDYKNYPDWVLRPTSKQQQINSGIFHYLEGNPADMDHVHYLLGQDQYTAVIDSLGEVLQAYPEEHFKDNKNQLVLVTFSAVANTLISNLIHRKDEVGNPQLWPTDDLNANINLAPAIANLTKQQADMGLPARVNVDNIFVGKLVHAVQHEKNAQHYVAQIYDGLSEQGLACAVIGSHLTGGVFEQQVTAQHIALAQQQDPARAQNILAVTKFTMQAAAVTQPTSGLGQKIVTKFFPKLAHVFG